MLSEKKQYLSQYLFQAKKIERYEKLEKMCTKEKNYYLKAINASIRLRNEIEEKISKIDNEILKEILYEKYIFGKTLEDISLILNYSKRHTERLHKKALEQLEI